VALLFVATKRVALILRAPTLNTLELFAVVIGDIITETQLVGKAVPKVTALPPPVAIKPVAPLLKIIPPGKVCPMKVLDWLALKPKLVLKEAILMAVAAAAEPVELPSTVFAPMVSEDTTIQAELALLRCLSVAVAVSNQSIPATVGVGAVAPELLDLIAKRASFRSDLKAGKPWLAMLKSC